MMLRSKNYTRGLVEVDVAHNVDTTIGKLCEAITLYSRDLIMRRIVQSSHNRQDQKKISWRLTSFAAIAITSACTGQPLTSHAVPASATAAIGLASPVISSESETISSDTPAGLAPYRLGPSDVISITIYRHPELSIPQASSGTTNGGVSINNDGTVDLSLVGNINLAGLTVAEAQQVLQRSYAKYIQQVDVAVQLVSPKSMRYYLLGDFSQPGAKMSDRQLSLLDALSLGGSLNIANADLFQAYVAMGTQKLPLDIRSLLVDGDMTQNIMLEPGSTIVIPPASDEKAFVFGAVGRPGAIDFEGGGLSVLQALSEAGMDLNSYSAAKLSQVRIIRSHGAGADFIIVDAAKILKGEAAPFALEPGDVVFVAPDTVATWNQALNMLLPSLSAISGLLNPFVSIKYLSQRN
jgi:polysaccharide biosynthesis/export protein